MPLSQDSLSLPTERLSQVALPGASSSLSVAVVDGPTLLLWSSGTVEQCKTTGELTLELGLGEAVVIGRQEGGQIEYLDPRYQPTRMLPNSPHAVVTSLLRGQDQCVSRGHFMLRGDTRGIVLVNGVPRRGGGIRPPKNGTRMLAPCHRRLGAGEEFLIERGASATIRLPNKTILLLRA